jgi:hypothetical protein
MCGFLFLYKINKIYFPDNTCYVHKGQVVYFLYSFVSNKHLYLAV